MNLCNIYLNIQNQKYKLLLNCKVYTRTQGILVQVYDFSGSEQQLPMRPSMAHTQPTLVGHSGLDGSQGRVMMMRVDDEVQGGCEGPGIMWRLVT